MSNAENPMVARLAAVKNAGAKAPAATTPSAVRPAPIRRKSKEAGERWEERVARATFHIDRELLDRLPAAAEAAGMSKSEFVREALRSAIESVNH